MSVFKPQELKMKRLKMSKNIGRVYRENKCRGCSVVLTRMDFAKIMGKFSKVKIEYENVTPKTKKNFNTRSSTPTNSRLKTNENAMVLIHRTAYNRHPVKEQYSKTQNNSKVNNTVHSSPNNVLKENNRLKKTSIKDNSNYNKKLLHKTSYTKTYGITFTTPTVLRYEDQNKISLSEILPVIDKITLPSEEWHIDYFPKDGEPKQDKVYDRIAAELEDLMNIKKEDKENKNSQSNDASDAKIDEFPSIMDILNDSSVESGKNKICETSNSDLKSTIEPSDVEAMLMGNNTIKKTYDNEEMETDHTDANNLIGEGEQTSTEPSLTSLIGQVTGDAMQNLENEDHVTTDVKDEGSDELSPDIIKLENVFGGETKEDKSNNTEEIKSVNITHVVFKHIIDGNCSRSVMCPKNLNYSVELEGKPVELIGAPKFICNIQDLQVLLQIVNESYLSSVYVKH